MGEYETGYNSRNPVTDGGLDEFPKYPIGYLVPEPQRQIDLLPLGNFGNEYTNDCQIVYNKDFYGKDVHYYELTLTQPDTEVKDPYNLISAFRKIVQSKMFKVRDYMRCIELTKTGTPHLHALLISDCYINASKVNYKHRFTVSKVRNLSAWVNYLLKEIMSPPIIDYCHTKGIEQYEYCQNTQVIQEEPPAED